MKRIIKIFAAAITLALIFTNLSCEDPFDPASKIKSRRFLGIKVDPVEATFDEEVRFSALVVNKDGTVFDTDDGDILWVISGDDVMRESGEAAEGAIDFRNVWLETVLTGPFVWKVPDKKTFDESFGALESNGKILTVTAVVFNKGQIDLSNPDFDIDFDMKKNILTFKLFVVSEQPENRRMANPEVKQIYVTDPSCNELDINEDGEFSTSGHKVKINAIPEDYHKELVFSWFSNEKDFAPDFEGNQTLEKSNTGLANVYVVLRKAYFFDHDDNRRTRITGINWPDDTASPQDKVIPIRFE